MARPPKDSDDRMTEILRIPVTAEQKRLIAETAKVNPSGTAAWIRQVLLEAVAEQSARPRRQKP